MIQLSVKYDIKDKETKMTIEMAGEFESQDEAALTVLYMTVLDLLQDGRLEAMITDESETEFKTAARAMVDRITEGIEQTDDLYKLFGLGK